MLREHNHLPRMTRGTSLARLLGESGSPSSRWSRIAASRDPTPMCPPCTIALFAVVPAIDTVSCNCRFGKVTHRLGNPWGLHHFPSQIDAVRARCSRPSAPLGGSEGNLEGAVVCRGSFSSS